MTDFFNQYGSQIIAKSAEHLYISAIALALGIVIAVTLGIVLTPTTKVANVVITFLHIGIEFWP